MSEEPNKLDPMDRRQILREVHDKVGRVPRREDVREHADINPEALTIGHKTWTSAVAAAGINPTRQELIDHINAVADEVDKHLPSRNDVINRGPYNDDHFQTVFGSFSKAREVAGVNDKAREKIKTTISRLHGEHGEIPTRDMLEDEGDVPAWLVYEVFDSLGDAVEAAGLNPRHGTKRIPREDLVAEIKRVAEMLDDPDISKTEVVEHGNYSEAPYTREFESWAAAKEAAGLNAPAAGTISNETLLKDLEGIVEATDNPIIPNIVYKYTGHFPDMYAGRFGSIPEALEEAGEVANADDVITYENSGEAPDVEGVVVRRLPVPTRETFRTMLRDICDEIGWTPTREQFVARSDKKAKRYLARYPSYKALVRDAGLDPRVPGPTVEVDRATVVDALRDVVAAVDGRPTREDIEELCDYPLMTIAEHFDTLDDAINAATED